MQIHSTSETVGNLLGEMIGWLLGTGGAMDQGSRHSHGTGSMRSDSGVAVDPLESVTVEFEVEMIYRSARAAVSPKRFGRPPFAAQPIVDAEIIDHESDTTADTLTR